MSVKVLESAEISCKCSNELVQATIFEETFQSEFGFEVKHNYGKCNNCDKVFALARCEDGDF